MNMEYRIKNIAITLTTLVLLGTGVFAYAQTTDCSSIIIGGEPLKTCDNGSCTNDIKLCPKVTTTTTTSTSGSAALGSTALDGTCSGNLRYDLKAAQACADLAEKEGALLGYSIDCTVDVREEYKIQEANPIGTQTAYNPQCVINGAYTADASILAGYDNQGGSCTYSVYYDSSGRPITEQCGAYRSSMWYSVPCDLADTSTGTAGSTSGSVTCTQGAAQIFGTTNPASWNPTTLASRSGSGGLTSGSGSSGSSLFNLGPIPSGYQAQGSLLSYTRQLMDLLNRLFTSLQNTTSSTRYVDNLNQTLTPTTTPPINTTPLPFTLTSDKTYYCIGQTPLYTAIGPAGLVGAKILWSSYWNPVFLGTPIPTLEIDADYGYTMKSDPAGSKWTNYGSTWSTSNLGTWKKVAKINGIERSVEFHVREQCSTPPPSPKPLACTPKSQTVSKYSVAYLTAFDNTNDFNWSATYNWSSPSATKTSGTGVNYGTSYSTAGTYQVTLSSGGKSDVCSVTVQ